jgi:hypothetical protein
MYHFTRFVSLAKRYVNIHGDPGSLQSIRQNVRRGLTWIIGLGLNLGINLAYRCHYVSSKANMTRGGL